MYLLKGNVACIAVMTFPRTLLLASYVYCLSPVVPFHRTHYVSEGSHVLEGNLWQCHWQVLGQKYSNCPAGLQPSVGAGEES
jgi:hypothetical protein